MTLTEFISDTEALCQFIQALPSENSTYEFDVDVETIENGRTRATVNGIKTVRVSSTMNYGSASNCAVNLYMRGSYQYDSLIGQTSYIWTGLSEAGRFTPSPAPTNYYYVTSHTWAYKNATHSIIEVNYTGYMVVGGVAYTAILTYSIPYEAWWTN